MYNRYFILLISFLLTGNGMYAQKKLLTSGIYRQLTDMNAR